MKSARILRWLACIIVFASVVGCDSSSTKHLTESSGKSMLLAKMAADQKDMYVLAFANIRQTLSEHTRNDYSQGIYPEYLQGFMRIPNPQVIVQRLVRAGYVSQSQTSFTVPNVSGDYNVELTWPKGGWTRNASYALTLSMKPTYDSISGHYHIEAWYSNGQHAMTSDGPLTGTVDPNGTIHLTYGSQYGATNTDYAFKSENGVETLTGKQPFLTGMPTMTLVGHGPGGEITVPEYSYTLSSKFETLSPPQQDQIKAGKIEIDQITNLLLSSDTMAQASFGWHVDFNDAGKALSGQDRISGTGQVIFGKQPDGNWVVAEYSL